LLNPGNYLEREKTTTKRPSTQKVCLQAVTT
jgi:hypothetical protein